MNVTSGSSKKGLGKMSIIDPKKVGGSVATNINAVGAMFNKDGAPADNTTKKWTRPTQTTTVESSSNNVMITSTEMLNNIKEASMAGLNSVTGGFSGKGLGVQTSGTQTAVIGGTAIGGKPVVVAGTTATTTTNQATNVTTAVTTPGTIIKPGKIVVAGGQPVQNNNVIQAGSVVTAGGVAGTPDQKLANAKRNAGKLLNRILEMSYNLTEQEEKYLLELMDAIGMKETLLSAAGLGTATPINAQVVLNAINEMNQVMVANANITSNNIELANSIYGRLDVLTLEAQAGGYNEAELVTVLAELYANGMINAQDASKPNLVFCFNTLKTQIERIIGTGAGTVQVSGVRTAATSNNVVRTIASPAQTQTVTTTATTTTGQTGGKMFVRPQNQVTSRFVSTGGGGINLNRGTFSGGTGVRSVGLVTTQNGANNLRGAISTGAGVTAGTGVTVRATVGGGGVGGQALYNAANQDVNYSNRGSVGVTAGAGGSGFVRQDLRQQGVQTVGRPAISQAQYNTGSVQGSGTQSPIMQYMNM